MKSKRIIKKKILTSLVATSLLVGTCACNKKPEPTNEPKVIIQTVIVTATPTPTEKIEPTETTYETTETTHETTVETTVETTKETTESTTVETNEYGHRVGSYDANLDAIFNKINDINRKIDDVDFNKVKDKTIEYAKTLIDFIFYGGTIDGKTFNELSDEAKQKVYEELQRVDSFIMQFIPDYKEKIGEKYNLVKDFASTTLEKAKEIFNSHVEVNIEKGKPKKLILNNEKNG